MKTSSLAEYKAFVAEHLRARELKRANNDEVTVNQIAMSTDDDILRKWLWKLLIISGPVTFIILPFCLSLIGTFLWPPIMGTLWLLTKMAMGMVLILFVLAILFTVPKSNA